MFSCSRAAISLSMSSSVASDSKNAISAGLAMISSLVAYDVLASSLTPKFSCKRIKLKSVAKLRANPTIACQLQRSLGRRGSPARVCALDQEPQHDRELPSSPRQHRHALIQNNPRPIEQQRDEAMRDIGQARYDEQDA